MLTVLSRSSEAGNLSLARLPRLPSRAACYTAILGCVRNTAMATLLHKRPLPRLQAR
jgi:hypothetical protein